MERQANQLFLHEMADRRGIVSDGDVILRAVRQLDPQSTHFEIHLHEGVQQVDERAWRGMLSPVWQAWMAARHHRLAEDTARWRKTALTAGSRTMQTDYVVARLQGLYWEGPVRLVMRWEGALDFVRPFEENSRLVVWEKAYRAGYVKDAPQRADFR